MAVRQPVNADFIKNIGDLSKHIDDVMKSSGLNAQTQEIASFLGQVNAALVHLLAEYITENVEKGEEA
jgi:hypothetical protein